MRTLKIERWVSGSENSYLFLDGCFHYQTKRVRMLRTKTNLTKEVPIEDIKSL